MELNYKRLVGTLTIIIPIVCSVGRNPESPTHPPLHMIMKMIAALGLIASFLLWSIYPGLP